MLALEVVPLLVADIDRASLIAALTAAMAAIVGCSTSLKARGPVKRPITFSMTPRQTVRHVPAVSSPPGQLVAHVAATRGPVTTEPP